VVILVPTCRTLGERASFSSGKLARAFLLLPLVVATALIALPVERAAALTDISGTWNLTLLHPDVMGSIPCSASISQPGSALSASMTCTGLGSGNLSGSINTTTGAFTLSGPLGGYQMNMSGTAAGDGNSMSGTFTLPPIPSNGTFSGFRKSVPAPLGGVAELPQIDSAPVAEPGASGEDMGVVAGPAAVALGGAVLIAFGGAGWYLRRGRRNENA